MFSGPYHLTVNILHIAVDIIQLIRLQEAVVPYSWQTIHVSKAALSGHLNGISVEGKASQWWKSEQLSIITLLITLAPLKS